MNERTIAFCIPIYHPEPAYLQELFRSIANQTRLPDEVVVTDDAPSVEIERLIGNWSHDLRVRYVANEHRLGMTGNWNESVARSRSEFVVLAGQDDAYLPTFTETAISVLASHPDARAVGIGRFTVDGAGRIIVSRRVNDREKIFVSQRLHELTQSDLLKLTLRNNNPLGVPPCLCFKRAAWKAIGGFSKEYEQAADVDFNYRICRNGKVLFLPTRLVRFREHQSSQTTRNKRSGVVGRERERFWRSYWDPELVGDAADDCRAALYSYLVLDLARACRRRSMADIRCILRFALWAGFPSLGALGRRIAEMVTKRNLDAR